MHPVRNLLLFLRRGVSSAAILTGVRTADTYRWKNEANLLESWDERTIQMARLVPPGSRVIEFGAGRMVMGNHLPPGCSYTPSDVVPRGEGALVIDLNAKELSEIGRFDVAVLSGVTEYVVDVPRLAAFLADRCPMVILSYSIILHESDRQTVLRRARGWVNDYTQKELITLFRRAGFACLERKRWKNQRIYAFERTEPR